MSNKLITTGIPTTYIFGGKHGYTWNPVKGCSNVDCFLHPANGSPNSGECWAAKACNMHAEPWAKAERRFLSEKFEEQVPSGVPLGPFMTNYIEEKFALERIGNHYCLNHNELRRNLSMFKPTWFVSQYEKQFPRDRSCIFVGSQTDIAYVKQEWIKKMLDKIKTNNEEREKAGLPLHIFQFLTKAPGKVYPFFDWPLNCWLGFTATNQKEYDKRKAQMFIWVDHGERIHYAYLEPMRGGIESDFNNLDWVIVGGGPDKLDPQWVRSIRDQCQKAEIPFYFKQWGDMIYFQDCQWLRKRDFQILNKRQKAQNKPPFIGNLIDGERWEQFPNVR